MSQFDSVFSPKGLSDVGKAYRARDNIFNITPDLPTKPREFCSFTQKCTVYWDNGVRGGECHGDCLSYGC